jgi:hypothetical protein
MQQSAVGPQSAPARRYGAAASAYLGAAAYQKRKRRQLRRPYSSLRQAPKRNTLRTLRFGRACA